VALSYGGVGKFCGESVSGHERGKFGCARPKAIIFDRHLRKSVALSYRSVAGQLDKIHVLEAEEFLRKKHVTLSLRVRVLREPFVPQGMRGPRSFT
jgi:hypothetical protein